MRLQAIPLHSRPREKIIERGASVLTDQELLALVLGTGTKSRDVLQIATNMLKRYSLKQILSEPIAQLSHIEGIGLHKATVLHAVDEIGQRVQSLGELFLVQSPQDVIKMSTFIRDKRKEHFVALYLNARNQLIKIDTISIGTLDSSIAHPRDVFHPAIVLGAASVIVTHNHPSGSELPSDADNVITERLVQSGKLLGIPLLDHIILGDPGYYSFKESKKM